MVDLGTIKKLRKEGYTLQMIGDEIGVTRQRVRQILKKHCGGTGMPFVSELRAAEICNCSWHQLAKLRKLGKINPKHSGCLWLYDRDEIEKAQLLLQKTCASCDKPISLERRKYCEECSAEYHRYSYPFFSQEDKKKHNEQTERYRKQNLERVREIGRKANKKYYEKKKRGKEALNAHRGHSEDTVA